MLARPFAVPDQEKEVTLLLGPPGCGKTRSVHETAPALFKQAAGGPTWFDGYVGQEDVLFDEFEGRFSKWELAIFNQVIDRFSLPGS